MKKCQKMVCISNAYIIKEFSPTQQLGVSQLLAFIIPFHYQNFYLLNKDSVLLILSNIHWLARKRKEVQSGNNYSFARWTTAIDPIVLSFHVCLLPFTKITKQPSSSFTRFAHDSPINLSNRKKHTSNLKRKDKFWISCKS